MSTLTFFPWMRLKTSVRVGSFVLLKYRRAKAPFPRDRKRQRVLDQILESYWQSRGVPVTEATILRVRNRKITDQLTPGEIDDVFDFGSLVAFSALAAREYFDYWYWNRDNIQMILQKFDDPAAGVYVETRRRHGGMGQMMTPNYFVVSRPVHVSMDEVAVDRRLLAALVSAKTGADWPRVREAVEIFNLASSESSNLSEWTELVLINAAFERLFESPGKEDVLATAFTHAIQPRRSTPPGKLARMVKNPDAASRFRKAASVREVWIRDLFRLRNEYAHGVLKGRYPALWSVKEHLLLASFAFPLAVKSLLRSNRHYSFSQVDRQQINAFEALIGEEHFRSSQQQPRWRRIISEADRERSIRAFVRSWRRNMPKPA